MRMRGTKAELDLIVRNFQNDINEKNILLVNGFGTKIDCMIVTPKEFLDLYYGSKYAMHDIQFGLKEV